MALWTNIQQHHIRKHTDTRTGVKYKILLAHLKSFMLILKCFLWPNLFDFFTQDSNYVYVNMEYSKLEPLGAFFLITFIGIMAIQVSYQLLYQFRRIDGRICNVSADLPYFYQNIPVMFFVQWHPLVTIPLVCGNASSPSDDSGTHCCFNKTRFVWRQEASQSGGVPQQARRWGGKLTFFGLPSLSLLCM